MELEEMQHAWNSLSTIVEKQEVFSHKILEKITQNSYHSKLTKIRYAELAGTMVCYAGAAYVSVHLTRIEGLHLQLMALLSIGLLLLLPIISLSSVRAIKYAHLSSATYLEAISTFGQQKIRFQKLQKINVCLGLLLMLLTMPVLAAILEKDLSQIPYFWTLIFPLFVLMVVVFAYWTLNAYNKTLNNLENMLSDLHN